MTTNRTILTTGCALIAALASAVIMAAGSHGATGIAAAAPSGSIDPATVSAATALTQAPVASPATMAKVHTTAADLRATGTRLEQGVPTPPTGQYNINWDAAAAQGGDNESGMSGVIQFQAACQWYQYALSHDISPATVAVLNSIPNWPTFRGQDYAQTLTNVAESITSGDQSVARAHVALNCVKH